MVFRYRAHISIFEEETNSSHGRQARERAKLGMVGQLSRRIWSGSPKIPECSQGVLMSPSASSGGGGGSRLSALLSPLRPAGEVMHPVPPHYCRASHVSQAGGASEVSCQLGWLGGASWTGPCWASQVGPTVPIRLAEPGLLGCLGGAWHGWHG